MIEEIRLRFSDFLNIVLIDETFLFINIWSLVHFLSGALGMFFVTKIFHRQGPKKQFLILFFALCLYEVLEMAFVLSGSSLFLKETNLDIFFDLVIGMLGGILFFRLFRK